MTHEHIDAAFQKAIAERRRRHLKVTLEIALGDLVALDGIEPVKAILRHYLDQLEHF